MRGLAVALLAALLAVPGVAARGSAGKIAYVHGSKALLIYIGSPLRQPILLTKPGTPHWSGDGRLVSFGGYVVAGRVQLPTADLTWALTGERAAYVTKAGGAAVWSPNGGRQAVVADGWGAQAVAWNRNGSLAVGRAVCHGACGRPAHTEIWVWRGGTLHRVIGPLHGNQTPMPFAWHNGHVLWWDYPDSGSIAADGVAVYENKRRIAAGLMYRDYVAVCGKHLAIASGGDRYATHGKRILFDGRDVSRDRSRSWVSPSCLPTGELVAAASPNSVPNRIGREHRALWQLLPKRRQWTHPPAGWTDENPQLLGQGYIVFIRTRQIPHKKDGEWLTTTRGKIELLSGRKLTELKEVGFTASDTSGDWLNYYGHYDWPSRIAVAP